MPIDLTETLLTPSKAAHLAPGRPHVSTVWRWMMRGCRGVRLESIVCAGRRFTSVESIERFVTRTTAAANGESPLTVSSESRQRQVELAEKELTRDGI